MAAQWIICADCKKPATTMGHNTKYCRACSARRNHERQYTARVKRSPTGTRSTTRIDSVERRRLAAELSVRRGPSWMLEGSPDLAWRVGAAVPFSWAFSKNHIYSFGERGHVHVRDEHRQARSDLTVRLQEALRRAGVTVVTHKLWIDILVEKSSHRGDAVNVIDGVCDAVKKAVPLDDRWYCIGRLDWEVVPEGGRIWVSLGQEECLESQVCSYCGRILPLAAFGANRSQVTGVSRTCRDCGAIARGVTVVSAAAVSLSVADRVEPVGEGCLGEPVIERGE